ncbi:MAG: amino acid adenylation domain-containing protein [Pseudomonadota bacterium]
MSELHNVENIYPLSPSQAGMLFHAIGGTAQPGDYVGQVRLTLKGPLDLEAFQAAWNKVIAGRDALRAAFIWEGLETPLQAIRTEVDPEWSNTDLSALPRDEQDRRLNTLAATERLSPIDLAAAPLMRFACARLGGERHCLIWTCHHLISDGWSHGLLLREALGRYAAARKGGLYSERSATDFGGFLAWRETRDESADAAFWTRYLHGLEAPTVFGRPAQAPNTREKARETCLVSAQLYARVTAAARELRVTPNAFLLTAWGICLRRHMGAEDVVFGAVTSGRPAELPGAMDAVGAFVSTNPARLKATPSDTFSGLVRRMQSDIEERQRHQFASLADIQSWSPLGIGQSLFDTVFVFENYPNTQAESLDLEIIEQEARDQSEYALALLLRPGDGLALEAIYDPARVEHARVSLLLAYFCEALGVFCDAPDALLSSTSLGGDQAIAAAEAFGRGPVLASSFAPVETAIGNISAEKPRATALSFKKTTLTYEALQARVREIAAILNGKDITAGDRIIIAVPRGPDAVCAMLAALRIGAAYVPIDPTYPGPRITAIAKSAKAALALVCPETTHLPLGDIEICALDGAVPSDAIISPADRIAERPAYVIFTSGSSGAPKGVVVSQSNLWASTAARTQFYGAAPRVFLLLSSLAFDSSVAGLYWTLVEGGHLVLSETRAEQDPKALGALIRDKKVTHLLCLPGLWDALLEAVAPSDLASLDTVILAGEAVAASVVARHRGTLPGVRLVNEYGPTEATVWCTAADLTNHDTGLTPPVGRPIPGASICVADVDGAPAPAGIPGEIMVGGQGVALGYLERPEATAKVFSGKAEEPERRFYRTGDIGMWDAGGSLHYLGRADRQVKIRGHRIECAEVEAALTEMPQVDAAFVFLEDSNGPKRLAALVEAERAPSRAELMARLPGAMCPDPILAVENIPRLPNGKRDGNAASSLIRAASAQHGPGLAPASKLEATLIEIWSECLGRDDVSPTDNFFDLGGDSLLSIRLASIAKRHGLSLVPHDVFDFPTVRELASRLARDDETSLSALGDNRVAVANAAGIGPSFFMVHGRKRMFSNLAACLAPQHRLGFLFGHWEDADLAPGQTIEGLAEAALGELKAFQPEGPYHLGGYSTGGMIALEMAQRLVAGGDAVALLFLLDPPAATTLREEAPQGAAADADDLAFTFSQKFRKHARKILTVGARDLPAYAGERVSRVFELYGRNPARAALVTGFRRLGQPVPMGARHPYILNVYNAAFARYRPKTYLGQTLIVTTPANLPDKGMPYWWRETFPELAVETIEANHISIQLDQTVLDNWAERLRRALGPQDD